MMKDNKETEAQELDDSMKALTDFTLQKAGASHGVFIFFYPDGDSSTHLNVNTDTLVQLPRILRKNILDVEKLIMHTAKEAAKELGIPEELMNNLEDIKNKLDHAFRGRK